MLTHNDLKKGVRIILDDQPCEILEANFMKKAQRRPVIQTKIRNLITGNVLERNFQQGEIFEEAEIKKFTAQFIYAHRHRFFFCHQDDSSKRFNLIAEQMGAAAKFLKQHQPVEVLTFKEKIIKVALPIKVQLKVTEAPPGAKGDRAQSGTKTVTLETGAKINTPLFITAGDIVEINTETEEYVKRI